MLGLDKRKIDKRKIDKMEIKKDRKLVYSISKRRRLFLFFWRNGFLPKIWPNFHYFRVASFTQNSCTKSVRIMQKLKIDNGEVLSDNPIEPESFWSIKSRCLIHPQSFFIFLIFFAVWTGQRIPYCKEIIFAFGSGA